MLTFRPAATGEEQKPPGRHLIVVTAVTDFNALPKTGGNFAASGEYDWLNHDPAPDRVQRIRDNRNPAAGAIEHVWDLPGLLYSRL